MNNREKKFMEFAEGIRSADEVLHGKADVDTTEAQSFREFRAVLALEHVVASLQPTIDDDISEQILAPWSRESESSTHAISKDHTRHDAALPAQHTAPAQLKRLQRCLHGLVAANVTLLVLLGTLLFHRDTPAQNAQITNSIPSGYTLLALELPWETDKVRAYDHVDLKVSYQNQEQEVLKELARFLPVHSISAVHDSDITHTRIAVLVPQAQVERILYARILGELEISPVRTSQNQHAAEQLVQTQKVRVLQDPLGREIILDAPQQPQVLYLDRGSAQVASRLVYHQGNWIEDPQVRIRAF